MGEKTDQIEQHIQEQRSELGEHISELQEKVKGAMDWRVQFEERPLTMLGIAFGGGLLLSALLPSASRAMEKRVNNGYHTTTDGGDVDYSAFENDEDTRSEPTPSKTWEKATDTFETIKAALVGVAAVKVGDYLESLIPGFNEQYKKYEGR